MHARSVAAFFLAFVFCGLVAGEGVEYGDGVYEGSHSFITVEVVIDSGRIDGVRILSHGGGGPRYREMVEPLTEEIVAAQSPEVDTVTGATVSSRHLKEAVREALRKAEK